jgi:hypothetical protein
MSRSAPSSRPRSITNQIFLEFALIVLEAKDLERGFFSRRIVDRYSYEAEFIALGNAVEPLTGRLAILALLK